MSAKDTADLSPLLEANRCVHTAALETGLFAAWQRGRCTCHTIIFNSAAQALEVHTMLRMKSWIAENFSPP